MLDYILLGLVLTLAFIMVVANVVLYFYKDKLDKRRTNGK